MQTSLFQTLRDTFGGSLLVFQASRAVVDDLTRIVEETVLRDQLAAMIFAGLENSRGWFDAADRYRQLGAKATHVSIFAADVASLPDKLVLVPLEEESPLRQERFLLALSEPFSVLITARSKEEEVEDEQDRSFETAVSFDPAVIKQALDLLLPDVHKALPEWAASPESAARQMRPHAPDSIYATRIVTRLAEQIQSHFQHTRAAIQENQRQYLELEQQQEQLLSLVRELSVPIIPLFAGVVVIPLVGAVDSYRANQLIENLLTGISVQQADIVILDITGIPAVDTGVANSLVQAVNAARLLGAHVILSGIGPHIAQTIVTLGVGFTDILTCSTLQKGIELALARQGMKIVRR